MFPTPETSLPVDRIVALLERTLLEGDPTRLLALYQFGSTVTGQTHPGSDVDLAILCRGALDPYAVFTTAQDLADIVGRPVDLVDLATASTVFRAQVIGSGRRILTRDATAAAEFEMYALGSYARLNLERRPALEAFDAKYRD